VSSDSQDSRSPRTKGSFSLPPSAPFSLSDMAKYISKWKSPENGFNLRIPVLPSLRKKAKEIKYSNIYKFESGGFPLQEMTQLSPERRGISCENSRSTNNQSIPNAAGAFRKERSLDTYFRYMRVDTSLTRKT
jgi:hypothetical protein